ncbi:hypothetical protein ACTFIY_007489 [Dictyostelium cf. discoideum]
MMKLVGLIVFILFICTFINGSTNTNEDVVETLTASTKQPDSQNSFDLEKIKESIRNRKKIFKIDQISSNHTLIREALIQRGYAESKSISKGFDIKWSWCWEMLGVRNKDQIVNHFINHDEIGSKSGLTKNMNKLYQNGDKELKDEISKIFPRSYILSNPLEKKAFIKDFNRLNNNNKIKNNNEKLVGISNDELLNFNNHYGENIISTTTTTTTTTTNEKEIILENDKEELIIYPIQNHIDGNKNIWICKPSANARGVGIRIFDDLNLLLEYSAQGNDEFIVQKYIESPYTIENTKFDIRQFVLVKSLNPLIIFKFRECYLRFCSIEYSNDDLNDRFVHLSNYQVQKDFSKDKNKWSKVSNQWSLSQFKDYLSTNENKVQWENELNEKIKKLVITTIKSWPRNGHNKGSFELLGFDILLNDQMEPMLLEVNTNPGLHLLTDNVKVHHKIAVDDLFKVVLDNQNLWYNQNNKDDHNQNWIKNLTNQQQIDYFGQWEPIYVGDFDKSIEHLSISRQNTLVNVGINNK